ncbi:MAG: hypothetical protein M3249_02920 [Thermoproteota archaeon]|nr:hypothetical protein [Thermoproteota archaeon]
MPKSEQPLTMVLRLTDRVEVYTDELGFPKVSDDEQTLRDTHEVLSSLQQLLGDPKVSVSDRQRSGQGRNFGGLDVITEARDIIFYLAGPGVLVSVIPLLKKFLELKLGRRKVRLEVQHGKKKKVIELENITEKEFRDAVNKLL